MVKFAVDGSSGYGRIGRILKWGSADVDYHTPSCLIYTRAGHIPNLTWDVALKWLRLNQSPIYQITLPSIYESLSSIKKFGGGVSAFCGMPKEALLHFSITDPLIRLDSGYNDAKSVAIWTKAGRRNITVKQYCDIVECCHVGSFETLLDYDTPSDSSNKRLTKAVKRTVDFCTEMVDGNIVPSEASGFVALGGGYSLYHRERFVNELCGSVLASGFALDLSHFVSYRQRSIKRPMKRKNSGSDEEINGFGDGKSAESNVSSQIQATSVKLVEASFDTALVDSLIAPVTEKLPIERLRLVSGPFSPSELVNLVRLGIDLFDSSFATLLAEGGKMLKLSSSYPRDPTYEILDFNDREKFEEDFVRPFEDCNCYTCSHYTKGYLQHLRNTKELLGPILLSIHNLEEYERAFTLIRSFIASYDRFEK